MKKFIKGVRFAPKNYSDEVEVKIQHYKKEGYKLPSRHLLRTEEQLAGIRESAKINTALLDYISANIREGMSTAEIDHMVYEFTTDHDAIPAPFMYEGFPKSVCTSINDVVCHGIPSTKEFLRSGDIVNVDVSTIYKGYFSDASRMYMIGEVKPETRLGAKVYYSNVGDVSSSTFKYLFYDMNWLFFCGWMFLFCIVVVIAVSMFTAAPSAEKIQGLVFGTSTPEQKAATRASWNKWDIIHTLIILGITAAFYWYFW